MFHKQIALVLFLILLTHGPANARSAGGSLTVSVAQVVEMIEKSPTDPSYRTLLIAYLSGIGETTGTLLKEASDRGISVGQCSGRIDLSASAVLSAVRASGAPETWEHTAATPIIVADMLARAGCR